MDYLTNPDGNGNKKIVIEALEIIIFYWNVQQEYGL